MTILLVLATVLTLTLWSIPGIKGQGFPFNLDFQTFDANQSNKFDFLGQAKIDSVSQTLRLSDPTDVNCQTTPCVGQVFFPDPVQLLDPVTNKTYSFSTSFTFTITSPMRFRAGDGFVFLLAASPLPIGTGSGTFGCFPPNPVKSVSPVVAVEFDTSLNAALYDINDNHVGVDLDYAQSVLSSDAGISSVNLSSGLLITSWVDYHHLYKSIEVRLSYYRVAATKPVNPILTLPLDLSSSWTSKMYVGFSTQIYHGSEQSCNIFSWSFTSFVETTLPPPPPPMEFNETGNSTTWARKTVELGKLVGVAIVAFALVAGVCGATVGYARFGCSVAGDPADLLNPEESLLIDTKRKREEVDDTTDVEGNVSANTQTPVRRTPSSSILGFGDIMFTNAVYDVPPVDTSGEYATETTSIDSKEIAETTSEDVGRKAEEITGYDSARTPLQAQVAWLLEKARADVEDSTEAQRFTYRELTEATDNFSESLQLGEGRYGVFYGGILANGVQFAVKRLTALHNQKTRTFKAEVSMLYHLQHPNLVGLLGWCKQSHEYFLVYNLISNGNLSRVIFQKGAIPWSERFKIIQNVADALEHLHERQTLHRNVKTTNIFLAGDNDGKLGDFGLAWLMDHDEDKGTKGYVAPEVRITNKLTTMAEVFSFGIVTLEILCERPVYDLDADPDALYLVNLVSTLVDNGTLRKEVSTDVEQLQEETDDPLMTLVASLGLLCCDQNPMARPSMKRVVQCLAGDIPFPPGPEPPDKYTTPSYQTTTTTEKENTTVSTVPKKSRGLTSSPELPQTDTTPPHTTTSATEEQNKIAARALKRSQESTSSPKLPQIITTPLHKTNSTTARKSKTVASPSKKIPGSPSSSRVRTHSIRAFSGFITGKAVDQVVLSSEQQSTSAGTSLTPTSEIKKGIPSDSPQVSAPSASNDPVLAREEPPVRVASAPAVDLDLRPASAPSGSSLKLVQDNSSRIPAVHSIKVESDIPSAPIIQRMQLSNEVKSSADGQESHASTIYSYCYSLLEELVSVLLKYVDDGDPLPIIPDAEAFQHDESQTTSEQLPGPPFRPPPNPPFRPPPNPPPVPPRRPPPPSPSPVPEPDPPFPIPGPIPRRPPPLRPPRPPGPPPPPPPPPPHGPEALAEGNPVQGKRQALKPDTTSESPASAQAEPHIGSSKKPTSKSGQSTETISFLDSTSTPAGPTSQVQKASKEREPRTSLRIPPTYKTSSPETIKSSKAKTPERSTTKHSPTQFSGVEAPSQLESSQLPSRTPPTSPVLSPTSALETRVALSTSPTKFPTKSEPAQSSRAEAPTQFVSSQPNRSYMTYPPFSILPPTQDLNITAALPALPEKKAVRQGKTKPQRISMTKTEPAPSSKLRQIVQPSSTKTNQPELSSASQPSFPLTPSTSNLDQRPSLSIRTTKRRHTPDSNFSTKATSSRESLKGNPDIPLSSTRHSAQPSPGDPTVYETQSKSKAAQPHLLSRLSISPVPLSVFDSKQTILSSPTSVKEKSSPELIQDKKTGSRSLPSKSRTSYPLTSTPITGARIKSSSIQPQLTSQLETSTPLPTPSGLNPVRGVPPYALPNKTASQSESTKALERSSSKSELSTSSRSTSSEKPFSSMSSQPELSLLSLPGPDPVPRVLLISTPPANKTSGTEFTKQKADALRTKSPTASSLISSSISKAPSRTGSSQSKSPPQTLPKSIKASSAPPKTRPTSPAPRKGHSDKMSQTSGTSTSK